MWRCYGLVWTLHCPKDSYCDVTMILPLLFRGIRADVSETRDNALAMRMHGDYRYSIDRLFVGFNAICCTFLINNLNIYWGYSPRVVELVAWLATSCVFGLAILRKIIGFVIAKLHCCCVKYIFVLDKRNTACLRDTLRQTSVGKSAARADLRSAWRPLTSLGTSAWPIGVTTQYSYCIT